MTPAWVFGIGALVALGCAACCVLDIRACGCKACAPCAPCRKEGWIAVTFAGAAVLCVLAWRIGGLR